jgi:hypothetical protein
VSCPIVIDVYFQRKPLAFPVGDDPALPYGDPCGRCGADSAAEDPRDRICGCTPCPVCTAATGSSCSYCRRSLGCYEHDVSIERHCATYCLASAEQRDEVHRSEDLWAACDALAEKLQRETPKPWPPSPRATDSSNRDGEVIMEKP